MPLLAALVIIVSIVADCVGSPNILLVTGPTSPNEGPALSADAALGKYVGLLTMIDESSLMYELPAAGRVAKYALGLVTSCVGAIAASSLEREAGSTRLDGL